MTKQFIIFVLNIAAVSSQFTHRKSMLINHYKHTKTQECFVSGNSTIPPTKSSDESNVNYQKHNSSGFQLQLFQDCKKMPSKHVSTSSLTNFNNLINIYSNKVTNKVSKISSNDVKEHNGFNLDGQSENDNDNITFEEKAREDGYSVTEPEENPYAVLLEIDSKSLCTGSLLTRNWVLTAAHCLVTSKNNHVASVKVYAGGNSLKELQSHDYPDGYQLLVSKEIVPHPKYDGVGPYDVGLVMVVGFFNMTKYVRTIKLSARPWTHIGYKHCKFTGFGKVYFSKSKASGDDFKRKTHSLEIKNPCLCNYKLKVLLGRELTKRIVCAKPKEDFGICSGDSGGGLICDRRLVATASALLSMYDVEYCEMDWLAATSCGTSQGLSFFLTVCPNIRWINEIVQVLTEKEISEECVDKNYAKTAKPYFILILFTFFTIFLNFNCNRLPVTNYSPYRYKN